MNFKHIRIVLKKEIVDLLRDRKTWLTSIILPFLLIPGLMLLIAKSQSTAEEEARSNIPIVIQNEYAPVLQTLQSNPAVKVVHKDNPEQALHDGDIRAIIKLDPEMKTNLERNLPAKVEITYDPTNQKSAVANQVLTNSIQGLQQQIVTSRLTQLHLTAETVTPFAIESVSAATEKQKAGGFLAFLIPLLLILSSASGCVAASTDLMAGEKERGTLEPLLTAPVNGMSLLAGKLLTVTLMGCISALASTCSMMLAISYVPDIAGTAGAAGTSDESIAFSLAAFTPLSISLILLFLFLLSTMFAAIMLGLSSLAKSFKEAQTYVSPVMLAAMVPPYLIMSMGPNELPLLYFFIPILNATSVFKELLFGIVDLTHVVIAVGSTLLFVIAAIGFTAALFRRESLIVKA